MLFRSCGPGTCAGAALSAGSRCSRRAAPSIGFRSRLFRSCGPGFRGGGARRRVALLLDGCLAVT